MMRTHRLAVEQQQLDPRHAHDLVHVALYRLQAIHLVPAKRRGNRFNFGL